MGVLGLPFGPIRGVMWLGRVIQEEVDRALHDPANIRRELEELDVAYRAGEVGEDEYQSQQQILVDRLWAGNSP